MQGYHYGVDDAAIYIPAVERFAHPSLFPYGADFFLSHSRVSFFSNVVGAMVRWLHVPLPWAVWSSIVLGIYLLLLAGALARHASASRAHARNGPQSLTLASVLTVPVAGSALPIMDPYLTARSLSTPAHPVSRSQPFSQPARPAAVLLARYRAAASADGGLWRCAGGVALAAALVPRLACPQRRRWPARSGPSFQRLPDGFHLGPAQEPYRETLYSRTFFFAWAWTWFEWAGALLPLAILFAITRIRFSAVTPVAVRLCRALLAARPHLHRGISSLQLQPILR